MPGGRIAGYVIHTPPGVTPTQKELANELGPSKVSGPDTPEALARSVGFSIERTVDVTEELKTTALAILAARTRFEAELRLAEGDECFEEEQVKKTGIVTGIERGLLVRSLVAARKA